MNQHIEKSINEMKDLKFDPAEVLEKMKADADNNPESDKSEDPEIDNVGLTFFNQIVETSVEIMGTKEVEDALVTLSTKLNMDQKCVTSLINLISVCMTNSAYRAIIFYDELLKSELTKQFDNIGNHINLGKADIEGIKGAIQIHQKRIGSIENDLLINNLRKATTPDSDNIAPNPKPNI